MVDAHGRTIRYLRVSVTDRCDLRCRYCMTEQMTFLPRAKLATLDELAIITERFIARGVRKVRLSGGEPLVRRDVVDLVHRLGRHVGGALDELTMTTNGTRLDRHAADLAEAGIRRVNIGLDISPLTANFCDGCNRVRLTTEGKLYTCLGHEDSRDLKAALRSRGIAGLDAAIADALSTKPRRHDFRIGAGASPAVARHMSVTGG